ncbi:MAG: hypothetical protein R3F29_10470 [Planctomycetota bacterium]
MNGPLRQPADRSLDEARVRAFVRRHEVGLGRFLRLCGCRGAATEEVAQDAFLVAIRRGFAAEGESGVARRFLFTTARHLWLRRVRDDRRRARRHADAVDRLWARELDGDDGQGWLDALERCREALPERSRQALDRTYRDGVGRAELAAELGIGEHGARTLLQRLRATLRDCIERRRRSEERAHG